TSRLRTRRLIPSRSRYASTISSCPTTPSWSSSAKSATPNTIPASNHGCVGHLPNMTVSRRTFLRALPAPLLAANKYDVVIRGGRVIDPSQRIDRVADVAVRDGKIAAIGSGFPAAHTIEAHGKLVVPGLIDIHLHGGEPGLPPSEVLSTGVTTMVDAGSTGADNVDGLIEIARTAPNRMRILLNIARLGNHNPDNHPEFLDGMALADV